MKARLTVEGSSSKKPEPGEPPRANRCADWNCASVSRVSPEIVRDRVAATKFDRSSKAVFAVTSFELWLGSM
jgi:hypothetical protein